MQIKKILLVHPPLTVHRDRLLDVGSFPLGLLYIASLLLENGYDVEVLDCVAEDRFNVTKVGTKLNRVGLSEKNLARRISKAAPDLVGISIPFSCQYSDAIRVNEIVKSVNGKIITVAGGAHVSAAPELVDPDVFDYCVSGEGEFALLSLADALKRDSSVDVPEVFSKDNVRNKRFPENNNFIKDLNKLPFPNYDLLPLEKYWSPGNRWVNMVASRGCHFTCNFCAVHSVMGKKVRLRSIDNVIYEIEFLKKRFGINNLYFEDDNMTHNIEWAKQLFREIIKRDLGITFHVRNGIRVDAVDNELFLLMKKSGFKEVTFSPESGSQKTLDEIIKKKLKLERVEEAIIMAKKAGLKVRNFLIIGFPQETKEDIFRTVEYAHKLRKMGGDSLWVSCATPYPGTSLFKECVKMGIINKDNLDFNRLSTLDSIISNESISLLILYIL